MNTATASRRMNESWRELIICNKSRLAALHVLTPPLVLGDARWTYGELLTTLVEVEGTLNSRPLTYGYDEVGSEPLTPSHLMVGRRLMSMPDALTTPSAGRGG